MIAFLMALLASLALAGCAPSDSATGRYQMISRQNDAVYVLDTQTGAVKSCALTGFMECTAWSLHGNPERKP